MRVLIVDDEPPARARLRSLLDELDEPIEIVGEAGEGEQAFALAAELQPEVALLDIRMPGMDGIRAALAMQQLSPVPAVIFVTAYDEHALEAFEANAIDYLLKPVRLERLRAALHKASLFTRAQYEALQQAGRVPGLTVTQRGATQRIPLDEIICLRADSKYVEVYHLGGLALSDASLKSIEKQYPGRFLRIHRNALVDPARMRELRRGDDGRNLLVLEGLEAPLEVSRRHLPQVRQVLRT